MSFGLDWLHQHSGLSWNHSSPKERWAEVANFSFQVGILFWLLLRVTAPATLSFCISLKLFFHPHSLSCHLSVCSYEIRHCHVLKARPGEWSWTEAFLFPRSWLMLPQPSLRNFPPPPGVGQGLWRTGCLGSEETVGSACHPEWASCSSVHLLPVYLAGSSWAELENLEKPVQAGGPRTDALSRPYTTRKVATVSGHTQLVLPILFSTQSQRLNLESHIMTFRKTYFTQAQR